MVKSLVMKFARGLWRYIQDDIMSTANMRASRLQYLLKAGSSLSFGVDLLFIGG